MINITNIQLNCYFFN